MTALYGANYTNAYVDVPATPYPAGEQNGNCRILFDSYTWTSAPAASDTISIGKLPAGARVVWAQIFVPATSGATGQFTLGYAANSVDSVDLDAFVKLADAGGQAALGIPTYESAGMFKSFSVETEVQLNVAELVANASGVVYASVHYIMD